MVVVYVIAWLALLGFPFLGIRRGSGTLLFAGVITLLAGLLVSLLTPAFTHLFANNMSNVGLCQLIVFVPLIAVAIPCGNYFNRFFMINFDPFDWVLGTVGGIITAIIVIHYYLLFTLSFYTATPQYTALHNAFLTKQVVYFEGWNSLQNYITTLESASDRSKMHEQMIDAQ